jgi:hypothetical protein
MNPVIINDTNVSPKDYYSNFGDVTSNAAQQMSQIQKNLNQSPSMEEQLKAKKKNDQGNFRCHV